MANEDKYTKARQIRAFLFIFGGGILAAFVLAVFLLYYYSPSGSYLAKNVLLDPQTLESLQHPKVQPRSKKRVPLSFDKMEFSYFDSGLNQWNREVIALSEYAQFFRLVENDRSFIEISDELKRAFIQGHPASLSLKARTDNLPSNPEFFLDIHFADNGDYFRVQLREHREGEGWAYFHHPDIYQQVLTIFSTK